MTTPKNKHILIFLLFCVVWICSLEPLLAEEKQERIRVEATGHAAIDKSNLGLSKENALKEAFRAALEKALGVRITAATVMEDLTITTDVVISQTWGHLLSYTILKEWQNQGSYFITISAEVSSDARWWAEFEGTLDVVRFHVKDLVLKTSFQTPEQILPGALYHDQAIVVPLKGDQYRLVAIHTESQQILWSRSLPDKLMTPLVTNGSLVIAVTNKQVLAINLQYGWVAWKFTLNEPVLQIPAIYRDVLYMTSQKGRLFALGLKKGNLLWQYASQSYFLTAPVAAGDKIFFGDGSGYLHALDINRQSRVFKQLINPKINTAPTPTQVFTYLNWNDGYDRVVAVNSVDGSRVWNFEGELATSATTTLTPYLAQGKILTIFTQAKESRVYLVDAKTGYKYWMQKLPENIQDIVAIGEGIIVLNTWQGIRILDFEHGTKLWESSGNSLKAQVLFGEDRLFHLHDRLIDVYR